MPEVNRLSLERGRAKFAYDCAVDGSKINKKKEYKSYVKKLPMLIKVNGLGASISFINSKSEKDQNKKGYSYYLLSNHLTEWLTKSGTISLQENQGLADFIISQPSQKYRHITIEVLAFLAWLKRFAEGLIEGEAEGD
ncbi:CRISPR-associated protein, Cmr5 family [Chloroherpeton thalassium ATCC 35110]|uniref:CRISPR type III-B/RAMP module-associated protein Cmr5 n=1 Tax=Chloroherpeton thalassium (strain ATCC 35110 / GB-78) TaxID=517418 RepID=B3QXD4_CHLT3|nr:type III-B CRISPR module-associated protein Cmr5 [Chloroherpeton thalassium]ACF13408.1 CRISPR-associated protein, Cmr5 family [Chloroherpeton thalassium ATCC 35110]